MVKKNKGWQKNEKISKIFFFKRIKIKGAIKEKLKNLRFVAKIFYYSIEIVRLTTLYFYSVLIDNFVTPFVFKIKKLKNKGWKKIRGNAAVSI